MPRRMLLVLCASALVLSGCARPEPFAPRRRPTADPPSQSVVASPTAAERERVNNFLRSGSASWDGKAWQPDQESTTFPNTDAARRRFPRLRVPEETLGRKLIGIVYVRGLHGRARRDVVLLYEGELTVEQTANAGRSIGPAVRPNETRETTGVDRAYATAEVFDNNDVKARAMIATVEWESEGIAYGVSCPKVSKDDVVRVARSLVP